MNTIFQCTDVSTGSLVEAPIPDPPAKGTVIKVRNEFITVNVSVTISKLATQLSQLALELALAQCHQVENSTSFQHSIAKHSKA